MKVYLPCKIGEQFVPKKFVGWENGRRVYKDSVLKETLIGFDCYFCQTRCLSIPTIVTKSGSLYSYDEIPDEQGGFGKSYVARYVCDVQQSYTKKKDGTLKAEPFRSIREWSDYEELHQEKRVKLVQMTLFDM